MELANNQPLFRIIHFNDVYDIQPNAKTGEAGIVNFKAHLQQHYLKDITFTLFSGDCFSPSVLSNLFEGQQMVHCLNTLRIDAACYGNHQFDYQIDHTEQLAKACKFPWLLGNLIDKRTQEPLGGAGQHLVLQKNGVKIGVFGVAEEDWLSLLTQDYQGELEYIDMISYSSYKADELKNKLGCNIVIALSHMRAPNDRKLASEVPQLDFVLGGHDHIILDEMIKNVHLIKSGSNFYNFSVIDFYPKTAKGCKHEGRNFNYNNQILKVTKVEEALVDKQIQAYVQDKMTKFREENQRVVGFTKVPLETRFCKIRSEQTNYGNFICDMVRAFYNCDAVMLNSGGVRIDELVPPGPIKFSLVSNIFDDFLVVKYVPGAILVDMLQNAVAKYPAYQGRFMMVSGIRYTFDADKPPYSRILRDQIQINEAPVKLDHIYKVALHNYTAKGGDGFNAFDTCKYAVTMQNAIRMLALLNRFFRANSQTSSVQLGDMLQLGAKRKSSKNDRLSNLMVGVQLIDDRYYVQIEPKVDGRVTILNKKAT